MKRNKIAALSLLGMVAGTLIAAPQASAMPTQCIRDAWRYGDMFGPQLSAPWVEATSQYLDENCTDEYPRTENNEPDWFVICHSNPGFCNAW